MALIDKLKRKVSERGKKSPATVRGGTPNLRTQAGPEAPRPAPPKGARHFVLLVLDSCRYDSFMAAHTPHMDALGTPQRRFSYATWTAPSHYNLLMGLLPHRSPQQVYASEVYKEEFQTYRQRLGFEGCNFSGMVPRLWLPNYLQREAGYTTHALVSMPVLNPRTPIAVDFDRFVLMDRHNHLGGCIDRMDFSGDRPSFHLINTGETHYPYATPDEPENDWPRIHGVHGVFRRLGDGQAVSQAEAPALFDQARLDALRQRQIRAVEHVDRTVGRLLDVVPRGTWVTITSDHGELFGEAGYFGHGPILHDKVMEVPFVEGLAR